MNLLKSLKRDSKGFGYIELIVILLVVVVIAGIGFFVYKNKTTAHAGSWTKIGSLDTLWPSPQGRAVETLYACVAPAPIGVNLGFQQVNVMATANSIAQTINLGVVIPTNSSNTPVAKDLGIQAVTGTAVYDSKSTSLLNPNLGGAGGGNEQTRGTDKPSARTFVTTKPGQTNFRVSLYQHDAGGYGFPAINANFYPHNVSGYDFRQSTGVSSSYLSNC
jgi:hypothetical protein